MTKQLKADLSLLGVTVVWGASFPIMSTALKSISPFTFITLRYFLSALILAVIFIRRFKNINLRSLKSGLFIGLSLFLGTAFQVVGLMYTTPSKSGFITGLSVILVPIMIAIIFRRLPDLKTGIGILLSIVGLSLMSLNGSLTISKGDFLTLMCAIAFAAMILLVDRYSKDIDIALVTCIEMAVVAFLAVFPAAIKERFSMNLSPIVIGAVIFTAVFCTVIAYGIQNKVQSYTNPTHAAIIFLAEPVFSAIFSIFIGDKLTGRILLGCVLILAGMVIINLKVNDEAKEKKQIS